MAMLGDDYFILPLVENDGVCEFIQQQPPQQQIDYYIDNGRPFHGAFERGSTVSAHPPIGEAP
jgi:hypothetical protein